MEWVLTTRASPLARPIADRHYNRQKVGAAQFVPPGRCIVLVTSSGDALWVTSWPFAQFVKHEWPGAWVCSCFRNESCHRASLLNVQAIAATLAIWPDYPLVDSLVGPVCFVSFIDRSKVKPTIVRGEKVWGWTWLKVGWEVIGETKSGLLALGLRPENLPSPSPPIGMQQILLFG